MSLFKIFLLYIKHGNKLEKALEHLLELEREKERELTKDNLNLCVRHQQEKNHSHFSPKNCHYCQLLDENHRLRNGLE